MILWWPLWLKAIQISRWEGTKSYNIFNKNITVEMTSPLLTDGLLGTKDRCSICSDGAGVTWKVDVKVKNFEYIDDVHSASYVQLLASWDFDKWFTVSNPGTLTGLPEGDSRLDVCCCTSRCARA